MSVIFVVVIILFLVAVVSVYNSLVGLRNQVTRAWANIDVILKQRFDEIPQLIQVIEQYTNYESGIITKLVEARKNYSAAKNVEDKMQSSQQATAAFQGLLALGENYPQLRSNDNFKQLQTRVSDLENQLSDRRESYNDVVTNLNTRIAQFPDVFFAKMLGYSELSLFKVSDDEKQAPSLKMKLPTDPS
jgi:LemA protein